MPEDGLERALGQRTLTQIRTRNPKISAGVAAAIEKALEVLPENRYQDIGEFQKALTLAMPAAVQSPTVSAPPKKPEKAVAEAAPKNPAPAPKKPAGRAPQRSGGFPLGCSLTIGFIALLAVAGGLAFAFIGPENILASLRTYSNPTPTFSIGGQTETALIPSFTETSTNGSTSMPAVGTDMPAPTVTPTAEPASIGKSRMIAFVSDRTGVPQIFSVGLDGKNLRQITNLSEGACQPDWSPDGMQLVFTSPCKSIDGPYIKTAIFRINADGSEQTSLTKAFGGDYDPAWSPDGKSIAMTSLQDGRQHIYVMDSNGDDRISISMPGAIDYQPRWSPDGKRIIFISLAGEQPIVFYENVDPAHLLRTEFSTVTYPTMSSDWSVDDYILYVLGSRGNVVIYQLDSRFNPVWSSTPYAGTTVARFSPDGQWVLFDMNIKNNRDIYLQPIAGAEEPRRITTDRSIETDPAWQPIPAGS
jgi:Tol biopolymer transport system component